MYAPNDGARPIPAVIRQCATAANRMKRRRPARSASNPSASASTAPTRTTASPVPSAASPTPYTSAAYGSVCVSRPPVPPP
jgi:hypothetical protein